MPEYRISHTNYKNWQIDRWIEADEDSKKDSRWEAYKYPGTLAQAVQGVLSLEMSKDTFYSAGDVLRAIDDAERRILARIENLLQERK